MHWLSDCTKATDAEKMVLRQKLRQAGNSFYTSVRSLAYGSRPVLATKQALLHVLIHTVAGPVQPAEAVSYLIVDEDDDEFIIGRHLLAVLGIDVDRQLEQLASHMGIPSSWKRMNPL
ncbi:hypothetical protein V7S43_000005 [Phytophthora oleae]|uniref:Reverse transcriptase Ty1/copia-type domain-containing protein n=1 Tax=Phytophthora oleae TaxID=2107226 RepID=A0ABD3G4I1_9STRA